MKLRDVFVIFADCGQDPWGYFTSLHEAQLAIETRFKKNLDWFPYGHGGDPDILLDGHLACRVDEDLTVVIVAAPIGALDEKLIRKDLKFNKQWNELHSDG